MPNKRIMRRVTQIYPDSRPPSGWRASLTCGHVVESWSGQHTGVLRRCRACEKEATDAEARERELLARQSLGEKGT